jgi:hypothetical protein
MASGHFETRRSKLGYTYEVWEPAVPRIADDFIDCCLYLYPSTVDAEAGTKIGGSGFVVGLHSKQYDDIFYLYAVTNRHVVETGGTVIRLNTNTGNTDILDYNERHWVLHPAGDDLAVCPLPSFNDKPYKYKAITERDHFITHAAIEELNIGPGDDVFVVGRFVNQEGRQRNVPSVRFGNIAQMPADIIRQARGAGFFDQESFVVEARSIGGYSGAPVFVGMDPTLLRNNHSGVVSNRIFLLGVCWGYITDWNPVCDNVGTPVQGGTQVKSNTGMMAVVPSWKLSELLHMANLEDARKKADDDIAKQRMSLAATPASIPPSAAVIEKSTDENPDHKADFDRLLQKAAKVTKDQ